MLSDVRENSVEDRINIVSDSPQLALLRSNSIRLDRSNKQKMDDG
jgi:hypothetical protein